MSEIKQRVYCMKCKKELTDVEDLEICECGSKNFIYGRTVVVENGKFMCECGSDTMKMNAHIDMSSKHITTYYCSNCGEPISTETYYESQYI